MPLEEALRIARDHLADCQREFRSIESVLRGTLDLSRVVAAWDHEKSRKVEDFAANFGVKLASKVQPQQVPDILAVTLDVIEHSQRVDQASKAVAMYEKKIDLMDKLTAGGDKQREALVRVQVTERTTAAYHFHADKYDFTFVPGRHYRLLAAKAAARLEELQVLLDTGEWERLMSLERFELVDFLFTK